MNNLLQAKGLFALSTFGGLEIIDVVYDVDDYVVFRWNFGKPGRISRAKIRYGKCGDYFKTKGHTIFLSDVIRAI